MLNSTFDAQLLLYISTTILYLTVTLYYTYYEINKSWVRLITDGNAGEVVISIVDSLYNCMKITVASYICECTIKQANRIIEIIHCCSVHEFDTEMRDELLQFSLQISLSQLGDSRSHFFRLNYTFLRGCISFVTTYLVIMIQWSQTIEAETTALYENETASM
ncbi:uncharacterized protein LOC143376702 [Andrena cerasifolii]|uniref:uncharacterized protein LOC143376702 n=1 Tax=Andrena cerasifolii TaxID=2819439 RepID=UPI004037F3D7